MNIPSETTCFCRSVGLAMSLLSAAATISNSFKAGLLRSRARTIFYS